MTRWSDARSWPAPLGCWPRGSFSSARRTAGRRARRRTWSAPDRVVGKSAMPPWLFEGSPTVYFLLTCVAVICLAAWWRTRKRKYLIGATVAGALLVGAYALDRL